MHIGSEEKRDMEYRGGREKRGGRRKGKEGKEEEGKPTTISMKSRIGDSTFTPSPHLSKVYLMFFKECKDLFKDFVELLRTLDLYQ